MTDEYRDTPFFKDGFYIYSTGQMVSEGNMIEGAQSLDALDVSQLKDLVKREE